MKPRIKKLIGIFVLMPVIFLYLAVAAMLGAYLPDFWLIKLVYYIVAGVIWAFPLKHLLLWMNTDPEITRSANEKQD